ncbi:MAG: nucleotidyl transferase AbiEii/AbiGii toxin family protein [Candidatus Aenigmatarchaeota archaeon]
MITVNDLKKLTSILGFNIWQIEKDYLQHLFLLFLSAHTKDELVFKGGTALQKIYALNRFSIDLDFSMRKKIEEKIMQKIVVGIKLFGFDCEYEKEKENFGLNFKFKINGPLYEGTEKTKSILRIEISKRENILLEPEIKEVVPIYPDLHPYTILVMQLEEILAEKIRAISTRTKARDVYDLWFLLKKGVKFDKELVNKKLKFYKKSFDKKLFFLNIKAIEKVWEIELKPLVTFVPNFKIIYKEIEEFMKC